MGILILKQRQGKSVKNTKLYECLLAIHFDYSECLRAFFYNYQGLVDKLCERYSGGADGSEEAYMTGELCHWLEKQGYFLLYTTVEQLDESVKEQLEGFIELYTFLLSCAEQDTLKLIDQLFFIPGQFAREFLKEERILIGMYEDADCKGKTEYTFNNTGTFSKVPCFFRRVRHEY